MVKTNQFWVLSLAIKIILHTCKRYYRIAGKFGEIGEFGELYMIHETKTIQISYYN